MYGNINIINKARQNALRACVYSFTAAQEHSATPRHISTPQN